MKKFQKSDISNQRYNPNLDKTNNNTFDLLKLLPQFLKILPQINLSNILPNSKSPIITSKQHKPENNNLKYAKLKLEEHQNKINALKQKSSN